MQLCFMGFLLCLRYRDVGIDEQGTALGGDFSAPSVASEGIRVDSCDTLHVPMNG